MLLPCPAGPGGDLIASLYHHDPASGRPSLHCNTRTGGMALLAPALGALYMKEHSSSGGGGELRATMAQHRFSPWQVSLIDESGATKSYHIHMALIF